MRKFILSLILFFLIISSYGQEKKSVVIYLKNGYTVKGEVVEQIPDKLIKIQIKDKSILEYKMEDIEKITSANGGSPNISFAFNLGVNSSGLSTTNEDMNKNLERNFNIVPGFIGFASNFKLSKFLSLQTEINIEQKGYTQKKIESPYIQQTNIIDTTNTTTLDYITIPILLQAKFGTKIKVFSNTGLYIGYKFHQNKPSNFYYYYYANHNKLDYGFLASAGTEIQLSNHFSLLAQFRYTKGLLNILKNDWRNYEYKNNSITLNIGLVYYINEKY
jgi:opacity protein-like surface antigen/sRNA-binding regulator protein Hfq